VLLLRAHNHGHRQRRPHRKCYEEYGGNSSITEPLCRDCKPRDGVDGCGILIDSRSTSDCLSCHDTGVARIRLRL
jgi:hypothetical protein